MRHERRGLRGSTRLIHVHAHSTTGGTFPPLQRLHRAPFTAARPRARPMMPTIRQRRVGQHLWEPSPVSGAGYRGVYVRYSAVCSRSGAGGSGGSDCSHEAERPSRCSPFLDHTCKSGQGKGRHGPSVCVSAEHRPEELSVCGTVRWMPSRPAHFCPRSARAARSYLCRPWALLRVRNGRRPLFTSRVTNNEGHLPR